MRMTKLKDEIEIIEFLKEAKEAFEFSEKLTTFGHLTPGSFFAMRYGLLDDCIVVFKIDEEFEPVNYQNVLKSGAVEKSS